MDVRIEAVVAVAKAIVNEIKTIVEIVVKTSSPVVSRFYSCPVISIGGTSISSINPEFSIGGVKAAA